MGLGSRTPEASRWPYFVVPPLVVALLGLCYLDCLLAPAGIIGSLLPEGLGLSLVTRNAEAGTTPAEKSYQPLPAEIRGELDIAAAAELDGRLVQHIESGEDVIYSIDPALQSRAQELLDDGNLLMGAIVLVDSRTGRILVLSSTGEALTPSAEEPAGVPAAFSAEAPAASVFKVVTGAALLETAGVSPTEEVCYWGGSHKLVLANLEEDPPKDKTCATLSYALGKSLNPVFAKLADRHLGHDTLEEAARRFGFGEILPLDYPAEPVVSSLEIPEDRLEFARTAAGFWHVHLTPLLAAFLAQSIAQGGAMLHPILVDEVRAGDQVVWAGQPRWLRRTVSAETASNLAAMMMNTTTTGTAHKYFIDPKGNPYLPGIQVAGKTGTLTRTTPFRAYTWFVGFAPADDPEVAVAALAVNAPGWKVKGTALARDILRKYFEIKKMAGEAAP